MPVRTGLRPKVKSQGEGEDVTPCAYCGITTAKHIIETYVVSKEGKDEVSTVTRKDLCGVCLVGHDVAVLRASDSSWCFGEVKEYDATQLHPFRMSFLDGKEEWADVSSKPSRDYLKFINIGLAPPVLEMMDHRSIGSFSSSSFSSMSIFDDGNAVPLFDDEKLFSSVDNKKKSSPIPHFCGSMKDMKTKETKSKPSMWTPEEDLNLQKIVHSFFIKGNKKSLKWPDVAKHCGSRNGKQCRERWINHLSLSLRTDVWSPKEDATLFMSFFRFGKSWCKIARLLKGRTDNGTKNRFHHLRRRLGKDFYRQVQKYSSMMVDRSSVSTDSDSVDAIQEKTRAVMKVLAAESKRTQYSHIKGYVFGPFVPVIDKTVMCKRCGLFIPSEQTGTTMCTITEWCEACTRIPPYVALDQLRECLEMRSLDDPKWPPTHTSGSIKTE